MKESHQIYIFTIFMALVWVFIVTTLGCSKAPEIKYEAPPTTEIEVVILNPNYVGKCFTHKEQQDFQINKLDPRGYDISNIYIAKDLLSNKKVISTVPAYYAVSDLSSYSEIDCKILYKKLMEQ